MMGAFKKLIEENGKRGECKVCFILHEKSVNFQSYRISNLVTKFGNRGWCMRAMRSVKRCITSYLYSARHRLAGSVCCPKIVSCSAEMAYLL